MLDLLQERLEGAFGRERLRRLHGARVAVIGGGLLGGQVLHHLAMLQIPTLLVEPGRVEPANLGNQLLPASAIGESKARTRAAQMAALNPSCAVRALEASVEDVGLGEFADCDLLVTGLDGRASRLAVNRIAQQLAKDWIDAAVDGSGERLLGTVSWFRPGRDDLACYGCRYDAAALGEIARERRPQGCASWRQPGRSDTPPTLMASPFGALVAAWQTSWALRVLLGEGGQWGQVGEGGVEPSLAGQQLQVAASAAPRVRTVRLARARSCAFPHQPLEPLRRVACRNVGALWELATRELGAPPDALAFPERSLAMGLECPACGSRRDLVRRCESVSDEDVVCACGAGVERLPVAVTDRIPAERIPGLAGHDWAALGIPPSDRVTAQRGSRALHFLLPGEGPGYGEAPR